MFLFFFNDTAPTEIYTLSLHDALPISPRPPRRGKEWSSGERGWCRGGPAAARRPWGDLAAGQALARDERGGPLDRKSTRLNSSHANISYAVFCLKKKNNTHRNTRDRGS